MTYVHVSRAAEGVTQGYLDELHGLWLEVSPDIPPPDCFICKGLVTPGGNVDPHWPYASTANRCSDHREIPVDWFAEE